MKKILDPKHLEGRNFIPRFNLDSNNVIASCFMTVTCTDGLMKYPTRMKFNQDQKSKACNWIKEGKIVSIDTNNGRKFDDLIKWVYEFEIQQENLSLEVKRDELRDYLLKKEGLDVKVKAPVNDFFLTLGEIIDLADTKLNQGLSARILIKGKRPYSEGTVKNWRMTLKMLKQFNSDKKMNLSFENITMDTYTAFVNYLQGLTVAKGPNAGKKYTDNYVGKYLKDLKTFLQIAFKQKKHNNNVFRDADFKKIVTEDQLTKYHQVYLKESEIKKIIKVKGLTWHQQNIRDRFVINLYSGFRISDMKTLTIQNFDFKAGLINHFTQKNEKEVSIPIHEEIYRIVEDYNGELPVQYSDQEVNREIKEICRKAGILGDIKIKEMRGGKIVSDVKQKWELITNHGARRSAITNATLNGVNDSDAEDMFAVGQKTIKSYKEATPQEKASKYVDHAAFRNK